MLAVNSSITKCLLVCVALIFARVEVASSEVFKLGLLHGDAEVFSYEISVLEMALSHADGDHKLEIVPYPNSSQKRIIETLKSQPDKTNVFFTANSPERDSELLRVNIPLTRGLLGHRVLVIKKENLNKFEKLKSLKELQTLSIGSGLGWAENEILRAAGFRIAEATYKRLWPMLDAGRFAAFHRGIQEYSIELDQRPEYELTTLPEVMITFPFDYFFFVSQKNRNLHDILEQGLLNAYNSGAFMENFKSHPAIRMAFERGNINGRKAIQIDNPLLSDQVKSIPDRFWHTPILLTN